MHLQLSKINAAYGRFVPREFLQLLELESIVDVRLGDHVKKEMTILFSDIRSFTSLSERMTPEDNFKFINSYLERMEPVVRQHHGFIDKYIGDAIMALFSRAPDDAVQASIAMLATLSEYNAGRRRAGYVPIQIGIGINTGDLMLGTVGGPSRMDGTVISDAVNLASRIEGMTKMYGATLLISEQTLSRLRSPGRYSIRIIDRVRVKGRSEAVSVYEVFDGDPLELRQAKLRTKELWERAWSLYLSQSFRAAQQAFEAVLDGNREDLAARIYVERCRQASIRGPSPKEWDGVTQLEGK
jgi:two-component system sensor histidine kinase ChiS